MGAKQVQTIYSLTYIHFLNKIHICTNVLSIFGLCGTEDCILGMREVRVFTITPNLIQVQILILRQVYLRISLCLGKSRGGGGCVDRESDYIVLIRVLSPSDTFLQRKLCNIHVFLKLYFQGKIRIASCWRISHGGFCVDCTNK